EQAFADWIAFLARWEGVDSDDPDDSGGRTRFGIAQNHNADLDVSALPRDDAERNTAERYWRGAGFDARAEEAPRVAVCVADFGFHSGPPRATRALQVLVGAKPDGICGPQTRAYVRLVREVAAGRADWEERVVRPLCDTRRAFLRHIADGAPAQAKF